MTLVRTKVTSPCAFMAWDWSLGYLTSLPNPNRILRISQRNHTTQLSRAASTAKGGEPQLPSALALQ